MIKKKSKYYVVWKGRQPGIYKSWEECLKQIHGFEGACYKKFDHLDKAQKAYSESPGKHIKTKKKNARVVSSKGIILPSISVDAACSGSPGIMEYQGVFTDSGKPIFHRGPFPKATNNIGEFLAIVHALALTDQKIEFKIPIYSDSVTAISWIKRKKCRTTLKRDNESEKVFERIESAERWLKSHEIKNPILKWNTKAWGEIPADFGRK